MFCEVHRRCHGEGTHNVCLPDELDLLCIRDAIQVLDGLALGHAGSQQIHKRFLRLWILRAVVSGCSAYLAELPAVALTRWTHMSLPWRTYMKLPLCLCRST
jgi:hypothetical protein